MKNEQLAHDLSIARMAGKQLPAKELVEEYRSCYKNILEYLYSEISPEAETSAFRRPC